MASSMGATGNPIGEAIAPFIGSAISIYFVRKLGVRELPEIMETSLTILAAGLGFLLFRMFFIAPYNLYQEQKKKADELLLMTEPKIKLACGAHLPNCHAKTLMRNPMWSKDLEPPSSFSTGYSAGYTGSISGFSFSAEASSKVRFLRLEAQADCIGSISDCSAKILSIKKGDEIRFGGNDMDAPFAMGSDPDAFSKTLKDKFPEHIDIIAIREDNKIVDVPHNNSKSIPFTRNLSAIYADTGQYELHVVVAGSGIKSAEKRLIFNWTGNWETATLEEYDTR